MAEPIRIANCSGFYGDRLAAAAEMVEGGPISVLTGDYLAELTMLILHRDRARDASRGYARTFLAQAEAILARCLQDGIRVVNNAGGVNPHGLADALRQLADTLGLSPRIAVVDGDDVMGRLEDWRARDLLHHLEHGSPLTPRDGIPLSAHAYLGGWGIAEALRRGADIVITGRTTDAASVIGAAAWHHGWSTDDHDALAGALVAGHVIECGAQATGGNYAFFGEVPSLRHPGFPLAEVEADGQSVITKHEGTDGLVSVGTVTAQLLYEIGGPVYANPDVVAHFDTVQLEVEGPDRVRISGVRGAAPPETLKAGVLCGVGYRNQVTFLLGGADIPRKAALLDEVFWSAVGGKDAFVEARTDVVRAALDDQPAPLRLSRVVMSARAYDAEAVGKRFTRRAVELALSHVPGLTLDGLPGKPRPCAAFWPTLVPRDDVPHRVHLQGDTFEPPEPATAPLPEAAPVAAPSPPTADTVVHVPLGRLAGARSGDKAGNANVGFWVREARHYDWLRHTLTETAIREWLGGFTGPVRIHPLPNLLAVNVELVGWLGLGVAANLAPDVQAKCLAEALRTVVVPIDVSLLRDVRS